MKEFCLVFVLCLFTTKDASAKCDVVNSIATCDSFDVPKGLQNTATFLEISNKSIKELPLFLFKSTNFGKISITNCSIKIIDPNTFVELKVSYLALAQNSIETIAAGAFKNLTNIEKITVRNNKLQIVTRGVFTKLPLKTLTLSSNLISTIEDSALEDLPNLNKLHLDSNRLENVFIHKIVSDPSKLEILWLHNNSLSIVTNHMLKGLTNLIILNLGFNKIQTIEEGTFEQTPLLQTLVLSVNLLKEIDGSIFPKKGSDSLENLYMDNNELMFLSTNFFFRLNGLKKITIVGNPWLCRCIEIIARILYDNEISERCQFEYSTGGKPLCISDNLPACSYKYNNELKMQYIQAKNSDKNSRKHVCIL